MYTWSYPLNMHVKIISCKPIQNVMNISHNLNKDMNIASRLHNFESIVKSLQYLPIVHKYTILYYQFLCECIANIL